MPLEYFSCWSWLYCVLSAGRGCQTAQWWRHPSRDLRAAKRLPVLSSWCHQRTGPKPMPHCSVVHCTTFPGLFLDLNYSILCSIQVNTVVSGALDRLHYEKDPCVKYDIGRKLWIYLHRDRSQEEFGNFWKNKCNNYRRQCQGPGEMWHKDVPQSLKCK